MQPDDDDDNDNDVDCVQPVDLSNCPELQPPEQSEAGVDNADNPFQ